ncbi:hypothetical protein Pan258_04190 [Symmachiella dynata]|nr:hypothetical protein Pan258_04190 [Symmachiella dynata]
MLLGLPRLTKIFHGSKRTDRRIEKGQQVGDKHIVQIQSSIPVCVFISQFLQVPSEQSDVLSTNHLHRPFPVHRRLMIASLVCHTKTNNKSSHLAQVKISLIISRTVLGSASVLQNQPETPSPRSGVNVGNRYGKSGLRCDALVPTSSSQKAESFWATRAVAVNLQPGYVESCVPNFGCPQ